ncbi:MAG: hypothetical protein ACK55Z_06515, partial [bacterium]
LLNYISYGILWRIFCQTGIFAGFSLYILNLAVRISAAMMAGYIIFSGCRTAYKGAKDGARSGEYYISKPLWSSGKIYAYGSPSSGLKKKRISEAAMGGAGEIIQYFLRGYSLYVLFA